MQNFRKSFQKVPKELIHWFPGHMGKGLKQMQQKLKLVDCVIEVHDARIPFSGRNTEFKYTISGIKPHILVLNKKDLIEKNNYPKIIDKIKQEDSDISNVVFTNCKDQKCDGIRKLMPLAQDLIQNSNRFNRSDQKEHCIMIIGVPNVGKSSLTNILRNRHLNRKAASAVGAVPGITRSVLTKIKICDDPLVFLLDTPGILTPKINETEVGLKLALCATLQDHQVGEDLIADYLLYWMNKNKRFSYTKLCSGVNEPTDSIGELLINIAKMLDKTKKIKHYDGSIVIRPDVIAAAQYFIKAFRTGGLGKMCLDQEYL